MSFGIGDNTVGVQAKLLEIHRNTQGVRDQRRAAQAELILALNRSDYMLDEPSGTLMQVRTGFVSLDMDA